MYVQGNYPYCYNQVNCREYPSVLNDPSVFYVEDNKMFRQGAITNKKSQTVQPLSEDEIKQIDQMIAELQELRELRKLPLEEQFEKLDMTEEADQDEKDLDSTELLRKRRLEEDEPDPEDEDNISQNKSKYSVLKYNQASISGDKLMQKLRGNYKISELGDNLMKNLGVTNG